MRYLGYIGLKNRTWDNGVVNYLSLIHEHNGSSGSTCLYRGKSRFSMVDLPVCPAPVSRTHLDIHNMISYAHTHAVDAKAWAHHKKEEFL